MSKEYPTTESVFFSTALTMKEKIAFLVIVNLFLRISVLAQTISIISPQNGNSFLLPEPIHIEAVMNGVEFASPSYLHITNTLTGYRKLKLGNNPTNLYAPGIDVVGSGNNMMEITLMDFSGNCVLICGFGVLI